MKTIQIIGRDFINSVVLLFSKITNFINFIYKIFLNMFTSKWYWNKIGEQFIEIGFNSLFLVALTALFTGGALALQTYVGALQFNIDKTIATIVVVSLTRELGPVLVGLMVAGRISTSIAAKISTMKVTEQLDALYVLSISSFNFLILPRIIAATISIPLLVILADILGILGGTLATSCVLNFNFHTYVLNSYNALDFNDVKSGIIKAFAFGFIIAIFGCYFGYEAKNNAEGVGQATIKSVVFASIFILLTNYIMTQLFFV